MLKNTSLVQRQSALYQEDIGESSINPRPWASRWTTFTRTTGYFYRIRAQPWICRTKQLLVLRDLSTIRQTSTYRRSRLCLHTVETPWAVRFVRHSTIRISAGRTHHPGGLERGERDGKWSLYNQSALQRQEPPWESKCSCRITNSFFGVLRLTQGYLTYTTVAKLNWEETWQPYWNPRSQAIFWFIFPRKTWEGDRMLRATTLVRDVWVYAPKVNNLI